MNRSHEVKHDDPKNPTFSNFRAWLKRNFAADWPEFLEIFDTYREPCEHRTPQGESSGYSIVRANDSMYYNTWCRGANGRYKAGFEFSDSGYYGFFEEVNA